MNADTRFPGFAAPAAGFEAPLEMLGAWHGRIEQQCGTLRRLVRHLAVQGRAPVAEQSAASGEATHGAIHGITDGTTGGATDGAPDGTTDGTPDRATDGAPDEVVGHEPMREAALEALNEATNAAAAHEPTSTHEAAHRTANEAVHGADAQARSAAAGVLRYFDSAALQHHADEEVDLFPALIEAMAGSDAVCIRQLTQRLSEEHRQLERAWRGLREPLARIAAGTARALNGDEVEAFATLYESHLALEEVELLPMAARLLGDAQLDDIGRAMRARRGIVAL